MTRLNLQQTCLLEVSGELSQTGQEKLQAHLAKHPESMLEYQLVRSRFQNIQRLAKLPLTDAQKQQIRDDIKRGIHKQLTARQQAERSQKRARLIYAALAGVSSLAACLVIAASIFLVQKNLDERQQMARDFAQQAEVIAQADMPNDTDESFSSVASDISTAEASNTPVVTRTFAGNDMMNLFDALDSVKAAGSPADNGMNQPTDLPMYPDQSSY